ncbi:ABC transporter ATP-binding protein [Parasphingorhabdus pacifica]
MTVVDVRALAVSVGGNRIVDEVSFAMGAGEVTALVGASGSGKTTTGLALLGEWPGGALVGGRVEVDGEVVDGDRPPRPGTVSYIPQQPSASLNPVRRIGSVLHEIAGQYVRGGTRAARRRSIRQLVHESLRRAQLPDGAELLRRYPHQLSGGQQQRVVLAHALLGDPKVVVADEPTTGQDVLTRGRIIDELRLIREQGIAVLVLTHDLDLVRALADQVVVMREGTVVEAGPTARVLGRPAHDYTRRLVEARAELPLPEREVERGQRPVVAVRSLTAGHREQPGRETVRDASVDIHPGDTCAIVGRSGSGKTTLARCIAGLHPFTGGEVRLDGVALAPSLRRRDRTQLARVQYVFQDARASFNEFVPVVDQVARTARRLRGFSRETAVERASVELARVGVPRSVASRRPGSLSGGELQRAALVRAVLSRPDLLICDEITSGLDAVTRAELLRELGELQRHTGCALVVITHDLAVVSGLTQRVLIIDDGRIVERGSTSDVLLAPRHDATRALVDAATDLGSAATRA